MDVNNKPAVTFYHRKPRTVGNYSIEFIFEDVRQRLRDKIKSRIAYSKYESTGLLKRLYNCMEAASRQSQINHITGDVNYLGLFLSKKRTIQTILDCVHLNSSTGVKYKVLKLFWLSIPEKRAKYLTAISESTKQEILKHIHCDPEKIKVIHVAISGRFKRKDKVFNKLKPRILQIGAAHNKNIPRLVEALKNIPCTLEIIGKREPKYESLMKEMGINYEYSSGLTDEEMVIRYEEADIIALPSTYEGFGMPILEGQAVGRPVLTSNILSMPEVAGDAACLVDPFDVQSIQNGITKIISDNDYRESLIIKGFENVKRFDPDKIAKDYLELYRDVAFNEPS